MAEKELQTLTEAITHAETMQKSRGKKKTSRLAEMRKDMKKKESESARTPPVTHEYRDNYEKTFGHT